jgi:glucose-1-phosphate adenylyltransferase
MPDKALVSMGNYLFKTSELERALVADHADKSSAHDFGKNVIPALIGDLPVYAYNFLDNTVPGELPEGKGYWRDVGTVDSYYEASMDLRSVSPLLNLYNYEWPIRTANLHLPPSKFVFNDEGRRGMAVDSLVANGSVISGSEVSNSIVFSNVFVHSFAEVDQSILFNGCNIGRGARLRRVICDKYVTIEDGAEIGFDPEIDARRFTITQSGVVVIPKGAVVPRKGQVKYTEILPPPGTIRARPHQPGSIKITEEDE